MSDSSDFGDRHGECSAWNNAEKGDTPHMPNRDMLRAITSNDERVTQEFHRFLADVEQLMNSARQLSGDSAAVARRRLEDKVAQAKVRLEAMRGSAAEAYPHRRPWWRNRTVQFAGVAAVAGALIATAVLARRTHR